MKRDMKRWAYRSILTTWLAALTACGGSGWDPAVRDSGFAPTRANPAVTEAIDEFLHKDPGMRRFFENAYGYAVFPTVGKAALTVGGAYGKGQVFERGVLVGSSRIMQLTVGLQLGGQAYREIIFFKDRDTMRDFQQGNFEFSAQASAVAVTAGASADASYDHGVAVFTMTKGGLMYEAAIGGQKFSYKPL